MTGQNANCFAAETGSSGWDARTERPSRQDATGARPVPHSESAAGTGISLHICAPAKIGYFAGMEANRFSRMLRLLMLNFGAALFAAGCATQNERSYNQDFNQNLPVAPTYSIQDGNDHHFTVTVHQGSPLQGTQRIIYLKGAASAIVEAEAKRRGWQNWDLNYIQDRDQGWMHVLVVDVTRKNAIQMTPAPPRNNP
jgi:hypothetical protein